MIIDKKKYKTPVFLLAFGIVFCVISAITSIDSEENWFARSGAVLSFISVVIQFMLSSLKKAELENLFKKEVRLKEKINAVKEKDFIYEIISISSVITGLVGTMIWGYGDLLY